MSAEISLKAFLEEFTTKVARKEKQLQKAHWLLQTTSSQDAADLKADLETECKLLFSDKGTYEHLLAWDGDKSLTDPLLKRQLNVLIRAFKQNMLSEALLQQIADKEARLNQIYGNFRAELNGKLLSENEILKLLKEEKDPKRRKQVWEASKEIGKQMAPEILSLVELRNRAAIELGYSDYFSMMLQLQEVDEKWLFETLEELVKQSDGAYNKMLEELQKKQSEKFQVSVADLGPWAWCDPFCQGDPLDVRELDTLVDQLDFLKVALDFYQAMGIDVQGIIGRSDNFEREGKNQHAFCQNIDRGEDVRMLNNIKPTIRWLETVLHELGHAVYELGFDPKLPWLLREPPHMITTEAMALLAGRQAYRNGFLKKVVESSDHKKGLMAKGEQSLTRRQLIFSRFVMVMTSVERELYRNPKQDMNKVWWDAVKKYQKISPPGKREGGTDWAAKVHMGLAPVYYFSYLLGELFASSIEEKLGELAKAESGQFLREKLFFPGNSLSWNKLIEHVTGNPLTSNDWLRQFT